VDWNNDGQLDILSGCYWTEGAQAAHIHVLYGKGGLEFAHAIPVLNEAGKPLANVQIGDDEGMANQSGDQISDAICTQQFLVDYNGNGVLDLVNGSFGNHFFLYRNHGTNEQPQLSARPQKIPVDFQGYHAAPHFCDWNNDGKLEMLTGSGAGGVLVSFNRGSREEPRWSPFEDLIPPSNQAAQILRSNADPVPGACSRVWAVDFNGDGWLDLLVGDAVRIYRPAEGLSEQEFFAKEEAYRIKLNEINSQRIDLFNRLNDSEKQTEDQELDTGAAMAAFQEQNKDLQNQMVELVHSRREWCQETATGHVWLYLRKPPATTAAQRKGTARTPIHLQPD
jgi:hypothetical protein